MTLVLKRYFMKEIEREKIENKILKEIPELHEIYLYELDDFEIKQLEEEITRKTYSSV
ncbi:hypothetical protein [Bacillus salipaludis]|uniref:hypothetical protein n=1 Tax=Bacillus salipaludis TaxID=2547811 RepID=UPI002E224370|nr:hypothetical protein [Bacillus salipaludis]